MKMKLRGQLRVIHAAALAGLMAALLALAGCGGGNPASTPTPPIATPPTAPVATPTAGNGQNTIVWANVTGATSYKIYFAVNSSASSAAQIKAANNTAPGVITSPYTHSGLTNDTAYSYVMTAINSAGESNPSAVVSATPTATAPAAPTVAAFSPVQGSVGTTVTINGTGFDATTPGNNTVSFNGTAATVTAATATQLTTTVPNGAATGPIAVAANGQAASSYPANRTFTVLTPPAAPTGVTASPASGSATISWNAVNGAVSYNIYYSTVAANATKAAGTPVNNVASSQVISGLTNGTTYHFVVTAVDNNGLESVESNSANTTPASPPNIFAFVSKPYPAGMGAPAFNATANINDGATPVTNATVTINSTQLTAPTAPSTTYTGNVPNTTGQQLSLSVTTGGNTYTETGNQFTADPVITAPANGGTVTVTADTVVSWNAAAPAPSNPYNVIVIDTATGTQVYPAPGAPMGTGTTSTNGLTIPAGTMTAGNSYAIIVFAITSLPVNTAAAGSTFEIGTWYYVAVTAQ